ncbi:ATP-grasp domain-containing protein [Marinithermofilum abyssi]|uniref:ATP-grasp domain-containing protein n=1 Tax=Marinithermofilum abyssi TaxID=1571185 RepID=A0A8J2YAR8_9BACL|nr:ATP-grasp domain-containing protein [Marinithermofilum abyssi]GGE18632.1 ATP-grasp domain-containing protein [Marinithermofilum abyssi]
MDTRSIQIKSVLTLKEIYGPGHIFNPRTSFQQLGWFPEDHASIDFMTGRELVVAGDMPVLCSQAVTTDVVINLLKEAGLEPASERYVYSTAGEYREILRNLSKGNEKVVLQFPHPAGELNEKSYSIQPELLAYLNNKASIDQLVPEENRPFRSVITRLSEIPHPLPIVIKVATGQPASGGVGVVICRTEEDLRYACQLFKDAESVVVEEFLPIVRNYCVQFVVTAKGKILYIGSSEQIVDERGRYMGNWIDHREVPEEVILTGRKIIERAKVLGYVGVAGFDIVITQEGDCYVLDLNFRLNGSSAALLLRDRIEEVYGAKRMCLHFFWNIQCDFDRLIRVVRQKMEEGRLIPLSIYDPNASPYRDAPGYLSGLLLGDSRKDVDHLNEQLIQEGISVY